MMQDLWLVRAVTNVSSDGLTQFTAANNRQPILSSSEQTLRKQRHRLGACTSLCGIDPRRWSPSLTTPTWVRLTVGFCIPPTRTRINPYPYLTGTGFDGYGLQTLLKEAHINVHAAWAQELYESGVGNATVERRRVGAFIDIPRCRWRNLIPYMIKSGVPLWFYWGTPPFADVSGSWAFLYRPNPTHPGELIDAFFARRATGSKAREATENAHEKKTRLDRLAQNGKNCPGKRGPRVFQWKVVSGFRIRQAVNRKEVDLVWENYPSRQIKYNSFSNEFDICSEFDEGDEDVIAPDEGDEGDIVSDASDDDLPPLPPYRGSLTWPRPPAAPSNSEVPRPPCSSGPHHVPSAPQSPNPSLAHQPASLSVQTTLPDPQARPLPTLPCQPAPSPPQPPSPSLGHQAASPSVRITLPSPPAPPLPTLSSSLS
ncbi:hypothetical protein BDZ97DRAFT_1921393 [Flammula alnicola]|nr:hypothetical protein BDZ97DRAFT_1921393 [Flammula alnicola]